MSFLKLLLFVDKRPAHQENIKSIKAHLKNLQSQSPFELGIVETGEQPYLVEYFKLVATPALVKISPSPRQTLAGSDLVAQLEEWWPRWQTSLREFQVNPSSRSPELGIPQPQENGYYAPGIASGIAGYSEESIRMSDELFKLHQEKEELKEQLNFKDQVLSMLAHDLRSPLTAASLAMETLELSENHKPSEQTTKLRQQLFKQSRKQFGIMKRMIGDLLEASRSVNVKLNVSPRKINLMVLCEEILAQFQKQPKVKLLRIKKDIPQDIPPVFVDPELLQQLFVNLLDNAAKYTPAGGTISLSLIHRTSQQVQVSISDTGHGIPQEKQERIFEGHFRLKRDEQKEGYGLGLALCRNIVRAHYGQIWVDSAPNKGSSFHFTLPVYR